MSFTRIPAVAIAASTLLAAGAAQAGDPAGPTFDLSVAAASEYVGKGLAKSDGEPAVSGTAAAAWGDFHASVFASTAKLSQGSDAEIITAVGWGRELAGVEVDVSAMHRVLPGSASGVDAHYWEYQADASRTFGRVSTRLRVNYSADGFAGTQEAWWTELQFGTALTRADKFTTAVASRRAHGGADYTAWNAGVKHKFDDHIALDVRWYDTDQHALGEKYEGRLVGALTYAF
jgi:uncharacterized protein (TIGR02001 family)